MQKMEKMHGQEHRQTGMVSSVIICNTTQENHEKVQVAFPPKKWSFVLPEMKKRSMGP